MDPLELSARFALAPNSLRYCGKETFSKSLSTFLASKSQKTRSKLESELKKFQAHYSYLSLIARANGLKPFSKGVSEALWLGNGLLKRVSKKDLQEMVLSDFAAPQFLSKSRAQKIASRIPAHALPHHSFHPLLIGSITGVIGRSLRNSDMCRVSWGSVISAGKHSAFLQSQSLARKNGKLTLIPALRKIRLSCSGISLVPNPKKGDLLATHWDFAIMKISQKQLKSLQYYTGKNTEAANLSSQPLK